MNKEYLDYIETELRPWLFQCVEDGYFSSYDDLRLRLHRLRFLYQCVSWQQQG